MKSSDNGLVWTEIRIPSPNSEAKPFITSIASDMSGEHLLASSNNRGVFISHDAGESWVPVTLDPSFRWMDVTSDAFGENLAAIAENEGIYFSIDHGQTWQESSSISKEGEWRSIVADRTGQYLTATSNKDGLYTSFDYGVSWVKANTPSHVKKWQSVTMDFTGQYLAAVAPGHGIYHSVDHGLTWVPLLEAFAHPAGIVPDQAVKPKDVSTAAVHEWQNIVSDATGQVLAAIDVDGMLFISNDYGHSWRATTNFPSQQKCASVAFDNEGKTLFALTEGDQTMFYSNDKGMTWSTHFARLDSSQMESQIAQGAGEKAFGSLFQGYRHYVPKINEAKAVRDDANGLFQGLFDSYQGIESETEIFSLNF